MYIGDKIFLLIQAIFIVLGVWLNWSWILICIPTIITTYSLFMIAFIDYFISHKYNIKVRK